MTKPNEETAADSNPIVSPSASVIVAIREATHAFMRRTGGHSPTDIWLGPTEVIMFDSYINQSLSVSQMMELEKAGKYEDAPNSNRGMIKDCACMYEGKIVRFMQARGVRVGVSFEPKDNEEPKEPGAHG